MPYPRDADIESLLRALLDGGVELIVVGGVAAVLHGAPTTTRDLDIVHRRTPENIERLLAVLGALDATVREPGWSCKDRQHCWHSGCQWGGPDAEKQIL